MRGIRSQIYSSEIIYHLIDYIQKEIKALQGPKIVEEKKGTFKILATFGKSKGSQIIGGKVIAGEINNGLKTKIWREDKIISEGLIKNLQINKEDVQRVGAGLECGMLFTSDEEAKEGDILEVYEVKEFKA